MSAAGAPITKLPPVGSATPVRARIDLRLLVGRGWDPEARVFAPAADDALFGYHRCERAGCPRAGQMDRSRALGLCDACTRNYLERAKGRRGGPISLEQFKALPVRRVAQAEREERLCRCLAAGPGNSAAPTGGLAVWIDVFVKAEGRMLA